MFFFLSVYFCALGGGAASDSRDERAFTRYF